jgi:hypothetical protein
LFKVRVAQLQMKSKSNSINRAGGAQDHKQIL